MARKKKEETATIFRDELLNPYHIIKDEYQYAVMRTVDGKDNKHVYEKPVGYYSKLSDALSKIAFEKTGDGETVALKEYIARLELLINNFKKYIDGK